MEKSPLGKLSPELRNRIYDLVLEDTRVINLTYEFNDRPSLPLVCRQLRNECLMMSLSRTAFTFIIRCEGTSPVGLKFMQGHRAAEQKERLKQQRRSADHRTDVDQVCTWLRILGPIKCRAIGTLRFCCLLGPDEELVVYSAHGWAQKCPMSGQQKQRLGRCVSPSYGVKAVLETYKKLGVRLKKPGGDGKLVGWKTVLDDVFTSYLDVVWIMGGT